MKTDITIWSEGVRLSGNMFKPDDLDAGERRPALLLCHGWGGPKEHLNNTYAQTFVAAGFIVMTFDYRGWFTSDARLVSTQAQPEPDENGEMTVKVRAIRDVVDPLDQIQDIKACLDYLSTEESVDADRLGIWGTSFGGGHVIMMAAIDPRIKCMVSQVGPARLVDLDVDAAATAMLRQRASDKAHGIDALVPPFEGAHESLVGLPDMAKFMQYDPLGQAHRITAPSLFLDQAGEELMDPDASYPRVLEAMNVNVDTAHHRFPGKHYDIYDKNYQEGAAMAQDWFVKYLKP